MSNLELPYSNACTIEEYEAGINDRALELSVSGLYTLIVRPRQNRADLFAMKWPSRILNLQPARTGQEIRFQTLDDDLCPHSGIPNGFLAPLQDGMVILGRKTLVVDQIQMGEGYFTAYDDGLNEDWFTHFEALEAAHDMSAKV